VHHVGNFSMVKYFSVYPVDKNEMSEAWSTYRGE